MTPREDLIARIDVLLADSHREATDSWALLKDIRAYLVDNRSVREAGKKGGAKMLATHGAEIYKRIGRKGGLATKETYGADHYAALGAVGGRQRQKLKRESGK